MTEPKRWIDEGPPEAVERLLHAAGREEPPAASLSRTLGALGIGVGAAGTASTAGAATTGAGLAAVGKTSGGLVTGTLVKWGLLATAVTAAGVTGKLMTTPESAAPNPATAPRVVASVPSEPRLASPELVPHVPVQASAVASAGEARPRGVSPRSAPQGGAPVVEAPLDAERLAEEVAQVDEARAALARGDAAAAITALDEYDARFGKRRFVPEALYLRMEALLRMGNAAAARKVAEQLATRFPSSPQAARARQVMEQTVF